MKKKIILLSLLLIAFAACFIPVTIQKTITVKASFFNTYQQLAKASNWKKWRTDLRRVYFSDSTQILDKQDTNGFKLSYANMNLYVRIVNGYSFYINENHTNKEFDYVYTIIPQKIPNVTSIIVTEKPSFIKYLFNLLTEKSFSKTHITDFKNFMENADLYYGYKIIKKKVTDTNIIVLRKVVLAKNNLSEARKSLFALKEYIFLKGLKQTQPLIAQFSQKIGDSLHVEISVGIPINKKIFTGNPIVFVEMPRNGNLYTVTFQGKFKERIKAYDALHRYFNDRNLPVVALPFETYLDNKLPENDSDIVNIQINFATY